VTVRRPPYSISGGMAASVVSQLEQMLADARAGKIVGMAFVTISHSGELKAGTAGSLGRDMLKASGALHQAATAATQG